MDRISEIKKRLKEINKEQTNIDKIIEKQEEDGNYDDSLYETLRKLEDERNNLGLELEAIENTL